MIVIESGGVLEGLCSQLNGRMITEGAWRRFNNHLSFDKQFYLHRLSVAAAILLLMSLGVLV